MTFNKWKKIMYIKETYSNKDILLNDILDKMYNKETLTQTEQDFLSNYDTIDDDLYKDRYHLTNESVFYTIVRILDDHVNVSYNKEGIVDTKYDYINDKYWLILYNNDKYELKDNLLYNLLFDTVRNEFILIIHDEYFEKIPINDK